MSPGSLERFVSALRGREAGARAGAQWVIGLLFLALLVLIPLRDVLRGDGGGPALPLVQLTTDVLAAEGACAGGDAVACRAAALAYRTGRGAPLDGDHAAVLLDRACQLGDHSACVTR